MTDINEVQLFPIQGHFEQKPGFLEVIENHPIHFEVCSRGYRKLRIAAIPPRNEFWKQDFGPLSYQNNWFKGPNGGLELLQGGTRYLDQVPFSPGLFPQYEIEINPGTNDIFLAFNVEEENSHPETRTWTLLTFDAEEPLTSSQEIRIVGKSKKNNECSMKTCEPCENMWADLDDICDIIARETWDVEKNHVPIYQRKSNKILY